jgi:hypothetical protein
MMALRNLSSAAKEQVVRRLRQLLHQHEEMVFSCIHGSVLEVSGRFRDIDVAVWVEPSEISPEAVVEYQCQLSAWLERSIPYPVDVRVLNYASLGFRHAASGGLLLFARDDEVWYNFREETWTQYLDFAPLARQMLFDLLGTSP